MATFRNKQTETEKGTYFCKKPLPYRCTVNYGRFSDVMNNRASQRKHNNIAGRSPDNNHNSFVDLQSENDSKRNRPKRDVFLLNALICLSFCCFYYTDSLDVISSN